MLMIIMKKEMKAEKEPPNLNMLILHERTKIKRRMSDFQFASSFTLNNDHNFSLRRSGRFVSCFVFTFLFSSLSWPCVQSKYYEAEYTSSEEQYNGLRNSSSTGEVGLAPPVLNLATRALIYANATCGQREPETYCKLVEHVQLRTRSSQCQVCDEQAGRGKRHPPSFAIDGSNRWWQSPTLQNGRENEWVTITIDLRQVYQVAYIIIKAAVSPRPGNWILERSIDGRIYEPWQYYAISDEECWNKYQIRAKPGKPHYIHDEEVICTSYYSSLYPLEGGEIHTSLVNGRPGADGPSEALTRFTMARFVRLRLQKIRTLHGDLMNIGDRDKSVMRRYFYSIKDISIGGHCVCFGHANECLMDSNSQSERCMCQHNTCGDRCDTCCPLFNQYPWGPGNSTAKAACQPCQCFGHADACVYDPVVAEQRLSVNPHGMMDGGGVCLDCKAHTDGINCEKCKVGYYRPRGVLQTDPHPCRKCQCDSLGSQDMGRCVADEKEAALSSKEPGDCICKEGFEGKFCDRCIMGYRGYPNCEPCPCHLAGILNMDCKGDCICKENVEGSMCAECKSGFYNLIKENPDGCTQCFCHGVTDKCSSSPFRVTQVTDQENWFVTDLHGTKVISLMSGMGLVENSKYQIANEEFTSFPMYYWGNAKSFSGNRVLSYGLSIFFHVSWVHARGDTSGKPITDYDLIIQSTNNMLAFSYTAHEGNNATVQVTLDEMSCFVLPDIDNNIIQRNPTPKLGTKCTRLDVMEGIHDVKRLLVRAKFHTDQIEGSLGFASMEKADVNVIAGPGERVASSVEVCECPKGYSGTSCQDCDYGYRKGNQESSWFNECIKCNCNGHSPSCDSDGKCLGCEHNTMGERCHLCKEGFYGNASSELQFSCKPCECPLAVASNNFSPTCRMTENSYECTACPEGYEGPFCERCTNGFYGNPTQPGDTCKPCACNNNVDSPSDSSNICDQLTGECLVCPRNTIGWNCDECLPGHYGNPLNGTCVPCECDEAGSISVDTCHPDTGQCPCKENFTGKRCQKCLPGHGNPEEGCPMCGCNQIGSVSDDCDTSTGQCKCKPGIGGRYCNQCLDQHFGFSVNGCLACHCHSEGSDSTVCDLNNGQCHCLPNVVGRKCDKCLAGYWNIACGTGCTRCDCDPVGSIGGECDMITGQCQCKPGVGGIRCDKCLDQCYGFGDTGCKICDPCEKPGHICDSVTGRCACPPNTEGSSCEKCRVGFWGYPLHGCQPCNCSQQGSTTPQCSPDTGKCNCSPGFEGDKCDTCKFGHYNYPLCHPCQCDSVGTASQFCNSEGICSCSSNGTCNCKANVIGAKCDRCKEGTYALEGKNPEGCMECFCFRKTNKCSQGYFKWQRLALPADRTVIPSRRSETTLEFINNLVVIPDQAKDIIIEKDISFSTPLYWQLPHIFLVDKVLSYNGFLRFRADSISGPTPMFPPRLLASYPLVQIQGNYKLILEHYAPAAQPGQLYEIRLHEDEWRLKHGPYNGLVTKEVMMVALQNLQHILIRGTHSPEVLNATLSGVSLDIAMPTSTNDDKSVAHGIEVCDCPPEYNSTSCQNPRIGYYRWYKRDYITSTVIIDLVGQAKACECNGRSNVCETETGFCQNCSENTGGRYCDQCAVGHYGDPFKKCLPCPCPSVWNNHAESCYKPMRSDVFQCFCRPGYAGKHYERCDYGFFGRPWETTGHCKPCNCNTYGSVSDECHEVTGQCNCRPGVSGRDCSKCADRHVIVGKTCTSCDDQCTGVLLNDLSQMSLSIKDTHIDQQAVSAIKHLHTWDNISKALLDKMDNRILVETFIDNLPTHETLGEILIVRGNELEESCGEQFIEAVSSKMKSQDNLNRINLISNEIRGCILLLNDYVEGNVVFEIDPEYARAEISGIIEDMKKIGLALEDMSDRIEDELDDVNDLKETVLVKIFNSSRVSRLHDDMSSMRNRLEDFMEYIRQANRNSDEANRIVITAKEFLQSGRMNVETIDNMTIDMDMKLVMAATTLSEAGYTNTELEQVLLMMEDILRDFRNQTKEVELKDNNLFELVPMFRAAHAQPAFDHVKGLKLHAQYMEGLLVRINGSEPFAAVTAYQRIIDGFDKAFETATEAFGLAVEATIKVEQIFSNYSESSLLKTSSYLINEGLQLSGHVENYMRSNISACKTNIDALKWKLKVGNESLKNVNIKLGDFDSDLRLTELIDQVDDTLVTVNEVSMDVMDTEAQIQEKLQRRIDSVADGTSLDSVDLTVRVNNAQYKLAQVKSESSRAEQKEKQVKTKFDSVENRMKHLRALITQARHKANTVGVSIGPDDTGTCFRLFKWPNIDTSTSIKFNFAPTKKSDSLLFYWPSSTNDDFISIEMVDLHIKASWELGSGLRTLIHPMKLAEISENSNDPDHWFQIVLERIGSYVTLDVIQISQDESGETSHLLTSSPINYLNSEEESTLLNLSPQDLIHIGGMSKQTRPNLVSNGLSGCIHNLHVNHKPIGLWNFVGNEGCAPCVECPDLNPEPSSGDLEYYFDGRGYAVVNRLQSKTFNSKFFDVSVQFKTLSENGLIFLVVNDTIGQMISLELTNGKVVMQVWHKSNDIANSLRIESGDAEEYNTGEWVNVRAVWVFQKGNQIGKLMIGKKADFTQEKKSQYPLSLDLYNAMYEIGGVSPTFDPSKWKQLTSVNSFVGCMKNILINNSPYDPLAGNYYGVETPCGGKTIYVTSFEGNGFSEFASQPMEKNFKFGLSFKTLSPTGLVLLSTSSSSNSNSVDENYYAIFLENGQIRMQIGIPQHQGPIDLVGNNSVRYDDGKFHSIRFFKKNRRLFLYVDDEEIVDSRLPKQAIQIPIASKRGLFIGGVSSTVRNRFSNATPLQVTRGFIGCIQNLYFGNELVSFNYPVAHRNQNLGQCPKSHEFDPASVPNHFLYPNTIGLVGINRFDHIARLTEESCSAHEHVIEQEDPLKSLQFGDTPNSYVTFNLDGSKTLKQRFNVTFHFRTFYPNGILFQGLKKKGNGGQCLLTYLKDGQIIVKLYGTSNRPQELVSPFSNLNDGEWHSVSLVKAEDKMYLHVDYANASQTKVPKIKAISKMHIGGFPPSSQECLENSVQRPEPFKGCIKNVIVNSHHINLDTSHATLHGVNPCFKKVEAGTFFRAGSHAIYTHNLTLGNIMELQLDFRSDSLNGLLFAFIPKKSSKYPTFVIYLEDGKVIGREISSNDDYYEAVVDFKHQPSFICDGNWHTIRANYEKGSITVRIDGHEPIFALAEPSRPTYTNGNAVVGSLYIGGVGDGTSRLAKRHQFHGCIRNISVNRQRKDWTDMALLSQLYLNSCPSS